MAKQFILGIGKQYHIISAIDFDEAKEKVVLGLMLQNYDLSVPSYRLYEVVNKKELVVADLMKIVEKREERELLKEAEDKERAEFERLKRKFGQTI